MNKGKLNVRDLINIGLFTAVYIVVFFAVGMTGYIPIMMLFLPFLIGVVGGIPIMLLITKVPKFGVLTIPGIIVTCFMFLTGHPWPVLVIGIPMAILGDVAAKIGNYQKWGYLLAGYTIFTMWSIGGLYPLFFMKETYLKSIESGYGIEYAEKLGSLMTASTLPIILGLGVIGAILGAYLGRGVLKKHFVRAGVA